MIRKILFVLVIAILILLTWRYYNEPKVEVKFVDVEQVILNEWLREDYPEEEYYCIEASFEIHNPNSDAMKVCVIQVPNRLKRLSSEIRDFNLVAALPFKPGQSRLVEVSFIISKDVISQEKAFDLISQSSYVAYSNDRFWGSVVYEQLKNRWKSPFISFLYGYRKVKVDYSLQQGRMN